MKANLYGLPVWQHPADYGGFSPDGDFYIYAQHRDSDALTRSNYGRIFADLKRLADTLPQPADDGEHGQGGAWVYDFRAGHWAVGWIEHLLIRADAPDELQREAAEILAALDDYPVYDESAYSELQWNEAAEYWEQMPLRDRVALLAENGGSIYAARRDEIPSNDGVWEALAYG